MQEVQLYIEGTRVELFDFEDISITSSIQNVRDISKVFTDFSKSFNVPASKVNNKLFKHYYNSDIDGFDARTKKDATIELNYLPFKDGKIKLNGVKLKNNKPYSYDITFFGNTVNLKDVIGKDELDQLSSLSSYDHAFSASEVLEGLTTNLHGGVIRYPLITHTQRYIYDSNSSTETDGNIAYHSGGGHTHGINYFDLKPALRVLEIIEAIQTKYTIANGYSQDIVFSDDFFDTSTEAFSNLYLWLHRTKGKIGSTSRGETVVSIPSGFTHLSGDDDFNFTTSDSIWQGTTTERSDIDATLTITPTQTSESYDIQVTDEVSNTILIDSRDLTGVQTFNLLLPKTTSGTTRPYMIKVRVIIDSVLAEYDAKWRIIEAEEQDPGEPPIVSDGTYQVLNIQVATEVIVVDNLPKIKIVDFLTGIFKMFNLTAYVNTSGTIVVKPLDDFYSAGVPYDITKYVDVEESVVSTSLPFKQITFEYAEPKTFLADEFSEINNKDFGKLEYDGGEKLDGGKYEIKLPFEKVVFERLTDVTGTPETDAQYGYFVNDKQEPLLAKPLLFYSVSQTVGSKKISYINGSEIPIGSGETYTSYNKPSNVNENGTPDYTLNFGAEINEWELVTSTNSLFEKFYKTYMTDTFNAKNRLTKITAYLPLRILLNNTLADRFIVNGKSYKINSLDIDLKTNKSTIELLNDF